jgi:hypothetical protein
MKTPENTEDNLNDPEWAGEGAIQTENSSDYLSKYRSITKSYL